MPSDVVTEKEQRPLCITAKVRQECVGSHGSRLTWLKKIKIQKENQESTIIALNEIMDQLTNLTKVYMEIN